MKRSRPDLEKLVSFICTQLQFPTEGYWGKLRIVLNYLKATKYVKRIMGYGDLIKLEKWVYAPHKITEDMREHTVVCMSCGTSCGVGIIHGKAPKQKLNTKSTTESEVVAVSEYLPYKIHIINIFGR